MAANVDTGQDQRQANASAPRMVDLLIDLEADDDLRAA
jgi:hypothetical protein